MEKEKRKQERENAKMERLRQVEIEKAGSLQKKQMRREIKEAKALANKARIVQNRCKSCKENEHDDMVTCCLVCEARFHKMCLGEMSFVTVCIFCRDKK